MSKETNIDPNIFDLMKILIEIHQRTPQMTQRFHIYISK